MSKKHSPPDRHWQFRAPPPTSGRLGWFFVVHDRRYGPYRDRAGAELARAAVRAAWEEAALRRGGRIWKGDGELWYASLPPEVRVRGGVPYVPPVPSDPAGSGWRALLDDVPRGPAGKERTPQR